MTARDVLAMATVGSAACLGRQGEGGILAAGSCGDLVAWPLEGVSFAGAWTVRAVYGRGHPEDSDPAEQHGTFAPPPSAAIPSR